MVKDKDIKGVISMLPKNAIYYFTQASVKRAMPSNELKSLAQAFGLNGNAYNNIEQAYTTALHDANENDFIYIGGSSFVVADLLTYINKK